MKKLATGGMVFLVTVAASPSLSSAHSWYPKECCSNQDCMPADRIEVDARGDLRVIVGPLRIWVPRGFAVRPSLDRRIHICFREEKDLKFLMPLCLFVPAES
jgi:hypothetical protein